MSDDLKSPHDPLTRPYDPRPKPTIIPTAAWNDEPLFNLSVNDEWVSHIVGALEVLDQPDTWTGDTEEIWLARQQVNEIMAALMFRPVAPRVFLFDGMTPTTDPSGDTGSVELGVLFSSSVDGFIVGLRAYMNALNTGTHYGHLFTNAGALVGTLTFPTVTSTGWYEADFASPIAIAATDLYIAAYHAPNGRYSKTDFDLDVTISEPPLSAWENGLYGNNGRYSYGAAGTVPTNMFNRANYFVSPIFQEY